MCWNVVWKLQVLWGVQAGNGHRKPGCTYFGKRFRRVYLVCPLMRPYRTKLYFTMCKMWLIFQPFVMVTVQ